MTDTSDLAVPSDLHGSAAQRLERLDELDAPDAEWLLRQLRTALLELAAIQPVVDAERERREDY